MSTRLTFALIREGSSDDGLLPHLRELIVRAGAPEAIGSPRNYPGTTIQRLSRLASEEAAVDIAFVHRDADGESGDIRRREIHDALSAFPPFMRGIPVVPVQETEAWLLLDEAQIRAVAGKPSGRAPLGLPKPTRVESVANPKEMLQTALLQASGASGRRRQVVQAKFSQHRRTLLERLDIDGQVRQLSAWRQLEDDIQRAVDDLIAGPVSST